MFNPQTKLLVTCALCIHWFNPMVWMMWSLFNRDVEISCDERVVRYIGEASKSAYALMLIQMAAAGSETAPFCSGLLSKRESNIMNERITAIMKIRKKTMPAVIAAAVLVISVAAAFATSAAETRREMLLALKFDGYGDMSISEYRDKVRALTDTEEYNDIIDRLFQDAPVYENYDTTDGTDNHEPYDFLYNVLGPIAASQQSISFDGYAETDFPSASRNASLAYTGTLTILDADLLTVGEYISALHHIEEDMENSLRGLSVGEQGIYDEDAVELYVEYEGKEIVGLREATAQEMKEITTRRQAATDSYQNEQ